MSTPNIQIYSTPTCGFCKQAKEFLTEKNIPFTEYNVASDAEKRNELVEKSGQMGVPVIDVDGQILIGYDRATLAKLIGIEA
jgi:glutaredoxin-like YruB-family protein